MSDPTVLFDREQLGKIAYEAYSSHTNGKSLVTGIELPVWEKLTDKIREAWCVSAIAVACEAVKTKK